MANYFNDFSGETVTVTTLKTAKAKKDRKRLNRNKRAIKRSQW